MASRADEVRGLLAELLLNNGEPVYDRPSGGGVVFIGADHDWPSLDAEARQLQSRIRDEYREWMELVRALLRGMPDYVEHDLKNANASIEDLIERGRTWEKSSASAVATASQVFDEILAFLADLFDGSGGVPIYVPDTNAVLQNPALDEWEFDGRFTMLLLPTVLTELDALKNHRNPSVAEKASKVITRIKGYRDRGGGSLRDGVTLRRDRSTLRSVAPEPSMDKSLPWFDPLNRDDRILASVIEVMRSHPRSPVILVTGDINMQNKAAHAAIPFAEPPDLGSAH